MLSALLWVSNAANASDPESELSADAISADLYKIEASVEDERFLLPHLDSYLEQLPTYVSWAKYCITDSTTRLTRIEESIEKLGGLVASEPTDVSLTRQKLVTKKSRLEYNLGSCKAVLVRSQAAIKEISIFRKVNLEKQSFARGRDIVTVLNETVTESHQWMYSLFAKLASAEGIHALAGSEFLMLLSIIAIALVVGLLIRKVLRRWDGERLSRLQRAKLSESDTGTRVLFALAMTTQRYIVPLLVSSIAGIFLYIETLDMVPMPLITIIMESVPLLVLAYSTTYLVFKALLEMGLRDEIDLAVARSLRRRFNILALIWLLGYMLFQTILAHSLSEAAFFMARAILGAIIILNVIWIIWLTKGIKGPGLNTSVRIIASLTLLGALIAELTGYRNLSGYALRGVVGTLIAYGLFQIISYLASDLLDELDTGKSSWQQQFRKTIGVSNSESIPGLFWVRVIVFVSIWVLFIATLLTVWNVPEADVKLIGSYITQGFTVGSIEIVPLRIFEAIIVLILLLVINGWFQRRFEKKWLAMTNMEQGARESIATVANYIGIAIAIVVTLATAGMDFSKLAIIAGALSVGIGFGLQNIVNNFVSGLILLFERPIKTGDWIVAGTVEGNVKKISIRSTQIESFDHADIIVPNSVLISGNLTNWVHKNRSGRICIPIGVAYGSNTEQVRDLLIKIAHDHSDAITGHTTMHDPKVMFLSFGDSSLDFELRFFVLDIKNRVDILSDMNFTIDKVFRENDIEIPFPQRDVHIREAITKASETDETTGKTET